MNKDLAEIVWDELKVTGRVFLTGGGGVGKTFTTRRVMELAKADGYFPVPTASTGIAARNLDEAGSTIHSVLGLGICESYGEWIRIKRNRYSKNKLFTEIDRILLVIDEISMISAEVFELINRIITEKYGSKDIKILLVGDTLQLSPVKSEKFFFQSYYYNDYTPIALTENKRNDDIVWNIFLNRLRFGEELNHYDFKFLSDSGNIHQVSSANEINDPLVIMLENTNKRVDAINETKLSELSSEPHMFVTEYKTSSYEFNTDLTPEEKLTIETYAQKNKDKFLKEFPLSLIMNYKIGEYVMILKNGKDYVNGDRGYIVDIQTNAKNEIECIEVELLNGNSVMIEKMNYEFYHPTIINKEGEKIVVSYIPYFPIRPAYAITVHKSQSLSLDHMFYNPMEAFADGQVYVALSRLANLGNLYLSTFNLNPYVRVNPRAKQFQKHVEKQYAIDQ